MRSKLREARKAKGLTQRALAIRVGISRPFMTNIEAGRANPPLDLAQKIAEELGTTIDDLFFSQSSDSSASPAVEG